jgi:hypothetical protein
MNGGEGVQSARRHNRANLTLLADHGRTFIDIVLGDDDDGDAKGHFTMVRGGKGPRGVLLAVLYSSVL